MNSLPRRGSRVMTVKLKTGATVKDVLAMLGDLPPGMELTETGHEVDGLGRSTAFLHFYDLGSP